MAMLYVACWTMNSNRLVNLTPSDRALQFERIAVQMDSYLRTMGNATGNPYHHMLVVPEYVFNAENGLVSRDDKHVLYRKLESISSRVPKMIIIAGTVAYKKEDRSGKSTYNVCPVLRDGKIVKKLYKADDDGVYQVNGTFRSKSDNGKAVPVFTVKGLTVGVDICMDYNNERLGQYLSAHGVARPDVHVQISGSNGAQDPAAQARLGGAYLHCDLGNKGTNGSRAWRITSENAGEAGAGTAVITPYATLTDTIGYVVVYAISL